MSEELFEAVQAQLEENRQRRRDRPGGGRYLLQGLVVCKRCGYGCYGKPTSRASAKGKVPYAYYRCTGSDAYRFGGQRLCWNKQVRTDVLDAAVWEDVRHLLSEPERVRAEYERRLQGPEAGPNQEVEHLNKLINNVKKMISRLIDAYGDGLLDKSEFEPRISAARERLAKLEVECRQRIGEATQEAELRLVIGQLEEFARRVSQGLQEPDWDTRREIVRALVKKVEIDEQEVRIVYRVSPSPFEGGPQQGRSQHCWGRDFSPLLANIVLNRLDWQLHEAGYRFVVADDFVVLCPAPQQGQEALILVKRVLEGELGLQLSPEKTKATTYGKGYDFLGFHLSSRSRRMRDQSEQKFKAKVKELTERHRNLDCDVVAKLNQVIRGTANYFATSFSTCRWTFQKLDSWIRMRLRAMKLKREELQRQS